MNVEVASSEGGGKEIFSRGARWRIKAEAGCLKEALRRGGRDRMEQKKTVYDDAGMSAVDRGGG